MCIFGLSVIKLKQTKTIKKLAGIGYFLKDIRYNKQQHCFS